MDLKIIEYPDTLLREKSQPVEQVDSAVAELLRQMLQKMYDTHGVGLAAPQVGILKRLVVIDVGSKEGQEKPLLMVNPEIVEKSEEIKKASEGCLSVPNQYAPVERFASVTVSYLDENGVRQEISADGLLAVALQHEIDHLNGILFIDYLSPLRRKLVINRLNKNRRLKGKE